MPSTDIYLPEDVYQKLCTAARTFRLTNKQLMRAILCAAVSEFERTEGRILPADQANPGTSAPTQRRQPAQEGSGAS